MERCANYDLFCVSGIMIAIMYDICWRSNTCGIRSPYGYLEASTGKPYMTIRERLTIAANQTKMAAGRTLVATRSVAAVVATNGVIVKAIGAFKKGKSDDQQATLDPEQGAEQLAVDLEKQLEEQTEPKQEMPERAEEKDEDVAAEEASEEEMEAEKGRQELAEEGGKEKDGAQDNGTDGGTPGSPEMAENHTGAAEAEEELAQREETAGKAAGDAQEEQA